MVLWRPIRPFRTNTQKRCPFHYRALECKSRKSRNTWNNRQIWPWSTEWSTAKANRVLPRERTGHSKHPLPTRQEKNLHMDITRWSTPKSDWLFSLQPKMEKLYTDSKNKIRSWLWLRSWTSYRSSDLKLKRVGITTKAFRYDLNQIPYDYTVEVRNRLKGLDLIDREADELWTEVRDIVQETRIKTIPMEKKCKKAKWLSEEALQIAMEWREVKSKGEKERYSLLNAEFQRIARRDKKAFLNGQCKDQVKYLVKPSRYTKRNSNLRQRNMRYWRTPNPVTDNRAVRVIILPDSTIHSFVNLAYVSLHKNTPDGDCSHEMKRRLFIGRKAMTNLASISKSRNIILPPNVHLDKAMVFPVVMYGCEIWTLKKAEHPRIGAFELWCWRRLLRIP